MKRRTLIASVGTLLGGSSLAVGSGAFGFVRTERELEVTVAGDKEAYLGLDPLDTNYASHCTHDRLTFNFDDDFVVPNGHGEGVGSDSVYEFAELFSATNQGTNSVRLFFRHDGAVGPDIRVYEYAPNPSEQPLTPDSPSSVLEPGEVVSFTMELDTTAVALDEYETTLEIVATAGDSEIGPNGG